MRRSNFVFFGNFLINRWNRIGFIIRFQVRRNEKINLNVFRFGNFDQVFDFFLVSRTPSRFVFEFKTFPRKLKAFSGESVRKKTPKNAPTWKTSNQPKKLKTLPLTSKPSREKKATRRFSVQCSSTSQTPFKNPQTTKPQVAPLWKKNQNRRFRNEFFWNVERVNF